MTSIERTAYPHISSKKSISQKTLDTCYLLTKEELNRSLGIKDLTDSDNGTHSINLIQVIDLTYFFYRHRVASKTAREYKIQ